MEHKTVVNYSKVLFGCDLKELVCKNLTPSGSPHLRELKCVTGKFGNSDHQLICTTSLHEHDFGQSCADGRSLRFEIAVIGSAHDEGLDLVLPKIIRQMLQENIWPADGAVIQNADALKPYQTVLQHIVIYAPTGHIPSSALFSESDAVQWMRAIPVSTRELIYASFHGVSKLLELLNKSNVDLTDFERKSVLYMKLHYKKAYNGDPSTLPLREHVPGAVQYKEPQQKRFWLVLNAGALVIMIFTVGGLLLRAKSAGMDMLNLSAEPLVIASILAALSLVPHELLHAICFREDAYFYTYLSKGALFVYGPEDFSKSRYVFMSLLPNILFGFIPYILFMIHPAWSVVGWFGCFSIPAGFGDYINVFNTLAQVQKGGVVYMYGEQSYWYMPEK